MDDRALELAGSLVAPRYVDAGAEALHSHARTLRSLLAQRRCPEDGLSDELVELLLLQLSLMDTNNFPGHVGGGEREGRVVSAIVRRRVYGMTHGVGRSGDLNADQPKAAGSSLLAKLTNAMMLDLVKLSGAVSTRAAGVVPMATGMTLSLVLRCVANTREKDLREGREKAASRAGEAGEEGDGRQEGMVGPPRFVIWPRIDQKTCLKCIEAAGLHPCVVPLRKVPAQGAKGDGAIPSFWQVHVDDVRAAVARVGGPQHVVCVLSTTSCFAPRLPDNTVAIAQLCHELDLPYVVNNAYGIQSRPIMNRIDAAVRLGRLDYYVQSGDKNFLVPVGGSVVCSGSEEKLRRVMALYAGRASAAPVTDLFITALGLGRKGMQKLWADRYTRRDELATALRSFASARGEVLLQEEGDTAGGDKGRGDADTPTDANAAGAAGAARRSPLQNDISFCLTMRHYHKQCGGGGGREAGLAKEKVEETRRAVMCEAAREFGAKLFHRGVTGPRVITPSLGLTTTIAGCTFANYGTHHDDDEDSDHAAGAGGEGDCPLLVIACGVGMTAGEVEALMARLKELWPAPPPDRSGDNNDSASSAPKSESNG